MKTLTFKNMKEFASMNGMALPNSDWIRISQEMITNFANATLDKQWIHVDPDRAKLESPFKSTIAHGFMSVALLSKFLEDLIHIESVKMGLNYGLNYVRFMQPVLVNSELQLQSAVSNIEQHDKGYKVTFSCTVVIKGQEKPACVAEFLALFIE